MKVVIKGKGKNMTEKLEVPEKIGCKLIVMKVKFSFYIAIIIYHLHTLLRWKYLIGLGDNFC